MSTIDKLIERDLVGEYADSITLHGRTAKQRYQRCADWDAIDRFSHKLSETYPNMCLVGNGDIYSIEQFNKLKESGVCAGFMVGRGALCKPWIFRELKEGKISDPSAEQRLEWLKNFAWYLLDYFGTDRMGVERSREQFLENYVYLCRYVPTGLLAKE